MNASNRARRFSINRVVLFLIACNQLGFSQAQSECPDGFVQNENGSCQVDQQLRCPPDTVFMNEKCRKIMCPMGELYNGICLQAACPPGLVWRGKRCQEPEYLTTIVEIENVLTNEIHENAMYYDKNVVNELVTQNPIVTSSEVTDLQPMTSTHSPSNLMSSTEKVTDTRCCTIRTPRICKCYDQKWICFNRSQRRCDARVCTTPIVYLKAPEIKYSHPILIMPPDSVHVNCIDGKCSQNETTLPDCSGCALNHRENCSAYCFLYMCPAETCSFMNLDLYCSYYPGQFGCIKEDGCLWNWC